MIRRAQPLPKSAILLRLQTMVGVGTSSNCDVLQDFAALVGSRVDDDRIDLLRAALSISRTEYPRLAFEPYLRKIDEYAARVRSLISDLGDTRQSVARLNQVLFTEEGFRGNTADYYEPRNSFVNDVLDRKLGIPITLSLVYMEVARRVGFPLVGVGMPGHFLLKHYDIEGHSILIDPFYGGAVISPDECCRRFDSVYGGQVPWEPEFLVTVSSRQMLTRMLNNLRSIYMAARKLRKALPIADMILSIYPRSPEDVKERALLRFATGNLRGSLNDLEDCMKMSPDASDADTIRETALAIRRTIAQMN